MADQASRRNIGQFRWGFRRFRRVFDVDGRERSGWRGDRDGHLYNGLEYTVVYAGDDKFQELQELKKYCGSLKKINVKNDNDEFKRDKVFNDYLLDKACR